MNRCLVLIVVAAGILMLVPACQKSTEPEVVNVAAYQLQGCLLNFGKRAVSDSCFSYQFREVLLLEFCVTGNCCPDSNRFTVGHTVGRDTITVSVIDTAGQLCYCLCTYMLHVEFSGLQGDSYQIVCRREDDPQRDVIYSERVYRTK